MITLRGLTKRYGKTLAVDDLDLRIHPGRVTGFLGPNGAGKTTTLRMVLGLDRPTAGQALINGRPYRELRSPLHTVGAVLDAKAVHPGRSARSHLLALARTHHIPARRVEEVLETVGLTEVARRRAGGFSLGMSQRLGIASALLGDPEVLILDEPVNGLDPDGVRWIRDLMRSLAEEGRTVFVSSHLMSEMQLTADHLVVIGRGRLITDAPLSEVLDDKAWTAVKVRAAHPEDLIDALTAEGAQVERPTASELLITGVDVERVGELAHRTGVALSELSTRDASLEQAYHELTSDSLQYQSTQATNGSPA
ncbi:ABC transporter ATP-binding protein [Nocardiopsis sp. JB363]|uniref:ABC transporter ATP-binding protein n=1 Tax=Nocardiopsis sp. JB363 TaxID=1434837 RepID=UPI00097A1DE9|nr:ABC transporter ATP-binding protein [Nocardiopsis sp. JB363]SIO85139.1 ABC transporter, ATP-binding protein [Nocardiopsis sp. JB363]